MRKEKVKLSCYKRFELLGILELEYPKFSEAHAYFNEAKNKYPELDMIDIDDGRILFIPSEEGLQCMISDPGKGMYNRPYFVPYHKKNMDDNE